MQRRTILSLAAVLAALGGPAAAHAATVASDGAGAYVFTAAAGEQTSLSIQNSDDEDQVIFYTGSGPAVTSAPRECVVEDWGAVECPLPARVRVVLGASDDRVTVSYGFPASVAVTIDGGAGNDRLSGGDGPDTLIGGAGNDELNGYAGNDVVDGGDGDDEVLGYSGADILRGGAGDDNLSPDGYEQPSPDVVDGGPGTDTIEDGYSSRFSDGPIPHIYLTLGGGADDGRAGEGDDVTGIERLELSNGMTLVGTDAPEYVHLVQVLDSSSLSGGGGNDDLHAGDGDDQLDGGTGDDHLDGGFGDDVIVGGPGRDVIFGDRAGGDCGPLWCKYPYGNDTIDARDGEVDSITCGAGTDTVYADAVDVVAPDCENVVRTGAAPAPAPAPVPPATPATPTPATPATPNAPAAPARATVSLARVLKLGAALKGGLPVKLANQKPGRLQVKVLRGGKVAASAFVKVGANGQGQRGAALHGRGARPAGPRAQRQAGARRGQRAQCDHAQALGQPSRSQARSSADSSSSSAARPSSSCSTVCGPIAVSIPGWARSQASATVPVATPRSWPSARARSRRASLAGECQERRTSPSVLSVPAK